VSVVTSVVVVAPKGWNWDKGRVERLGCALYAIHATRRGWPVTDGGEEYIEEPIPTSIDGRYLAGGGKVPGGTIWWLGMNHLDLDHLLEELDKVEEFHGVWVWSHAEYEDVPSTHLVGRQSPREDTA
jgi:hypothetical protein